MTESRQSPRIESLHVSNYRALKDITLEKITPLTVLLGPNGSGKSTVFDVFAFLAESFSDGLRKAWERRGRFREMRSRDQNGPVVIEIKYREKPGAPLITYHLEIEEEIRGPVVKREFLRWKRGNPAAPFHFLDYQYGQGKVITGDAPESSDIRVDKALSGPDVLAVNTLGTLAENPRVIALRSFISGWHLSYLSADAARGNPEAGAEGRFRVVNRIVIEELESWFIGDPTALRKAFTSLPRIDDRKGIFRNPDNGGSWESLHRFLRKHGIYKSSFPKIDAARRIAPHLNIYQNRSRSFQVFVAGMEALLA